jgi:hypothetical protein
MIAKCTECHHEWQAVYEPGRCTWCTAPGEQVATDYVENKIDWWSDQTREFMSRPKIKEIVNKILNKREHK